MAYNPLHKLENNIAAVRIALDHTIPSSQQLELLKQYSGFGGIKAILYPYGSREEWNKLGATREDTRLYDRVQELHKLLQSKFSEENYKTIISSLKNSVLTAFYTPPVIPQTLYQVLGQRDIVVKSLYEPSAGAGVFISEGVTSLKHLESITAVEKDILTGKVLQSLCKALPVEVKVHVAGFEETPANENGQYDLIVSNIPFGNFPVYDPAFPDNRISGKIHNYFFAKGLEKLREGGLLAYITTDAFLNNPSNAAARGHLFRQSDFVSLSVL